MPSRPRLCVDLLREAVRVAGLSRDERLALALDRDWAPSGAPDG